MICSHKYVACLCVHAKPIQLLSKKIWPVLVRGRWMHQAWQKLHFHVELEGVELIERAGSVSYFVFLEDPHAFDGSKLAIPFRCSQFGASWWERERERVSKCRHPTVGLVSILQQYLFSLGRTMISGSYIPCQRPPSKLAWVDDDVSFSLGKWKKKESEILNHVTFCEVLLYSRI